MTINKYQGKTKEEAIEKAKRELGQNAVVMNIKEIKPSGLFKVLKGSTYEVTAALEEKEKFANSFSAFNRPTKMQDKISLAADEKINVSQLQGKVSEPVQRMPESEQVQAPVRSVREIQKSNSNEELGRRLENLSNMLEKQLAAGEHKKEEKIEQTVRNSEGFQFIKMLYRTLLDNEVNEKYVNQIMDKAEKILPNGSSVDSILSHVYQRLILKLGEPNGIHLEGKKPRVVFFIGPTGVGKTTTIAKIASKYKVELGKRVAFLTADTYRIAAADQLRTYANILDAPMSIIYSAEEMNDAIGRVSDYDLIFVDTAGFSHKNDTQCRDMKKLIGGLRKKYEKEVYLVLSATTKYKDLLEIADTYKAIANYKLIFTKLDETTSYGNILNIKLYAGADLSYMTNGQNVPDDIEEFDTQKIVKQLLGGR